MKTLIVIEFSGEKLSNCTLEAITVARSVSSDIIGVILGHNLNLIVEKVRKYGFSTVYVVDNPVLQGINLLVHTRTLQALINELRPEIVISGATSYGQELMPRLAARFDKPILPDIQSIEIKDSNLLARRLLYHGKLYANIKTSLGAPYFVTVLPGLNVEAQQQDSTSEILSFDPEILEEDKREEFVEATTTEMMIDITKARVIVAGGRGVGSKQKFDVIYKSAEEIGAMVGATRAVIKAGWVSEDHKIGLTGKTVSPELYIACGISGAIKHLIGMRKSRTIIAITNDEEAPILSVAHYALIGDLHEVLPVLIKKLKEEAPNLIGH
ncbi:MAG: electron transfer flavoprotein subunit alpha/FixB family protein [Promethearchaeota archaeon]